MDIIDKDLLEKLKATVTDHNLDLTTEAIAVGLIKSGVPPEQVVVEYKNASKRPRRKDVSGYHVWFSEYDDKEYLFLEANRYGIYDSLPENLFHTEQGGRTEKNKYEIINEIKTHKAEENDARRFFLPFEQEYQSLRNVLYSIEEDFEKNNDNYKLINFFAGYWPVLKRLETRSAYIFLRIIPLLHVIRNDYTLVSKCMSMVLNADFTITSYRKSYLTSQFSGAGLGEGVLGETTTTGSKVCDGEHDLLISVKTSFLKGLRDFTEGGVKHGLVEELADYFLSANYWITIEYESYETSEFILDGESTLLGVTGVL